jgi:SSS family solute:Na+ symporter
MNQYVAQRLLGARDTRAAAGGALLAAGLKLLPLFIMVLPGAMAVLLLPDLERPDSVFPSLIVEFAPPGLTGLLIAGLLAAIMSSVDSTLNSASTLIMVDFVKPRRPGLSSRDIARLGRYCTLALMILAALWAPMIDRFPGLFAYLQQTFAYVTPPLVAVFVIGLWSQTVTARAAWRGLVSGHVLSAGLFIAGQLDWHRVHFTIIAGALCAATMLLVTVWQATESHSYSGSWSRRPREQTPALPAHFKFTGYALAVITLGMVAALR